MTLANNPFEIGFEKFCDLDGPTQYIGKSKLQEIRANGVQKLFGGLSLAKSLVQAAPNRGLFL